VKRPKGNNTSPHKNGGKGTQDSGGNSVQLRPFIALALTSDVKIQPTSLEGVGGQ